MQYENYSAKDFAADEHFINWVKNSNQQIELFWQQWLIEHPEKKQLIEEARLMVHSIHFKVDPQTQERTKAIWQRITATNEAQKYVSEKVKVRPLVTNIGWYRNWQKIAASLIGIVLLSTVVFFMYRNQSVEYKTAFGEKKEIALPDGSTVILNANSTLAVNKHWGTDREVWLEGEAFFSVKKKKISTQDQGDNYSKFTVHTKTIQVNVLGTAFNVSDRKRNTIVVLNSGQVRLNFPDSEENIFMKPGDLVEMSGVEQKITKKVVDPRIYSAWINNEWIIDDLSLREVVLKIEETYGVKVVIKNKDAAEKVLSGVVPTDNLSVLLKVLSTTLRLKIIKTDNYIMIE